MLTTYRLSSAAIVYPLDINSVESPSTITDATTTYTSRSMHEDLCAFCVAGICEQRVFDSPAWTGPLIVHGRSTWKA